MTVQRVSEHDIKDRNGRAITVGSKVKIAGQPNPVEVQEIDPRYGTVVVLVPFRGGQSQGLMLHGASVEVA